VESRLQYNLQDAAINEMNKVQWGVPSAESSRSVRGLGKGVSGKPYPRLCNARRPRLEGCWAS